MDFAALAVPQDGLITEFAYHDGLVRFVDFRDDESIVVGVASSDRKTITSLMLGSVKHFVANSVKRVI